VIELPDNVKGLEALSGIGKYTAGAIASIAFNKVEPLVDGNVLRVLSRLQACNLDIAEQKYHKSVFWPQATTLVKQSIDGTDDLRPGDFNQSLMELGALVCTPKSAKCKTCPVSEQCNVYKMKQDGEIETVEQFPVKKKKNAPQNETVVTCIFKHQDKYLCVKRPETGLLAGLWEFPSIMVKDETKLTQKLMINKIKTITLEKNDDVKKALKLDEETDADDFSFTYCGQVTHVFTHIKQLLHVFSVNVEEIDDTTSDTMRWMTSAEMNESGVPTLVKKVFKQYQNHNKLLGTGTQKKLVLINISKKRKREESEEENSDEDSDE
jgi:A/G-specific adenine glycosylase